jgi:hypothetical protein
VLLGHSGLKVPLLLALRRLLCQYTKVAVSLILFLAGLIALLKKVREDGHAMAPSFDHALVSLLHSHYHFSSRVPVFLCVCLCGSADISAA